MAKLHKEQKIKAGWSLPESTITKVKEEWEKRRTQLPLTERSSYYVGDTAAELIELAFRVLDARR